MLTESTDITEQELQNGIQIQKLPGISSHELKEPGKLRRIQQGLLLTLAGVSIGTWGIGVATNFLNASSPYQKEQRPAIGEPTEHTHTAVEGWLLAGMDLRQESPVMARDFTPATIQTIQPQLEEAKDSKAEKVEDPNFEQISISPRTIPLEQLDPTINSIESETNILDGQFENISNQTNAFAQQLIKDLEVRFNSQKEQSLLTRANEEVAYAMILYEKAQPEQREIQRLNLEFAQAQKNLIQHHASSLHHDYAILEANFKKKTLTAETIKTIQEHSLERPKWFLRFWQLEQERANLEVDPNKNDSTTQGKAYLEWVQNELNEANILHQQYSDRETFARTLEGGFVLTAQPLPDLETKIRSYKTELAELERVGALIDRFPPSWRQDIQQIAIGMFNNKVTTHRWGDIRLLSGVVTGKKEIIINVFGDNIIERSHRFENAIDQLEAELEGRNDSWAKERIEAFKKLYNFLQSGEQWWDQKVSFGQIIGEPFTYIALGGGGLGGQADEVYLNMSETGGHVYFQLSSFPVSQRPDLHWDDSPDPLYGQKVHYTKDTDRSKLASAYRQWLNDIDEFIAKKDAGDKEPLRRWLASWPDYHMAEMSMPVLVTGGNILLFKDTSFEKYFDQFISKGEFNSYGELAGWSMSLSNEDLGYFLKYFEPTLYPFIREVIKEKPSFLVEISPERKKKLDEVFTQKKKVIQQEERQTLKDFGDQLPLYAGKPWLNDLWPSYLRKIASFYQKYPGVLNSHPTADQFLKEVIIERDFNKKPPRP